jgi:nicotinamide mononucleotide transporter
MTVLEAAANAITAASILLAGRNSIHTWWTGIAGGILFAMLFYQNKLFADVALQLSFIGTSILGWSRWSPAAGGQILPISQSPRLLLAAFALGGLVVTAGYGALLFRFTNAYAPFWDSAILVASVIAQLLLIRRKIENWPCWLLVNSIAVPLYASRGLYLTSGLYACYWVNAILSYLHWRDQLQARVPDQLKAST